jgi:hypothetical protein
LRVQRCEERSTIVPSDRTVLSFYYRANSGEIALVRVNRGW